MGDIKNEWKGHRANMSRTTGLAPMDVEEMFSIVRRGKPHARIAGITLGDGYPLVFFFSTNNPTYHDPEHPDGSLDYAFAVSQHDRNTAATNHLLRPGSTVVVLKFDPTPTTQDAYRGLYRLAPEWTADVCLASRKWKLIPVHPMTRV